MLNLSGLGEFKYGRDTMYLQVKCDVICTVRPDSLRS